MRISDAIARLGADAKSAGIAVGVAGGLCLMLALGVNGRGAVSNLVSNLVSEPALAFDGTAAPSTAALTTSDGLRAAAIRTARPRL